MCCSLAQDEISFLFLISSRKRNKNSSCVRLLVKVHFRTRIYSTCQQKLLSFIPYLHKKVNRIHKNSLKWDYSKIISGDIWQAAIKRINHAHHIPRAVSIPCCSPPCGPEDLQSVVPTWWRSRPTGRVVFWFRAQWQSFEILDFLSGCGWELIPFLLCTWLFREENSPVPSYWSFYSRSFTFLGVFSPSLWYMCILYAQDEILSL